MGEELTFKDGLNFPWAQPSRLWYALWILVPIFGLFALGGYGIKIIRELVCGRIKEVPEFGKVWDNFVAGIIITLKSLPLVIVIAIGASILIRIPFIGGLLYTAFILATIVFVPWLFINLVMSGKIEDSFDVKNAWRIVSGNFKEYVMVVLRSLGVGIIYGLLSLVLVGIPCGMYSKYYFFADFYRRNK